MTLSQFKPEALGSLYTQEQLDLLDSIDTPIPRHQESPAETNLFRKESDDEGGGVSFHASMQWG
ncbi:uncharacterized protein N7506_005743 [Penicillium brevicompactum]|uniref:uncharacterized protein n=1 Tax=Penicillium brevicompactum TaxID=5074 RepID=UPI002540A953|nr:uncharacterized protein N7506_005743 [Penicillium brevicompactum]KAJ5335807.1 hypothetical protein N7506_005743 [Penicillium brevicompactum]